MVGGFCFQDSDQEAGMGILLLKTESDEEDDAGGAGSRSSNVQADTSEAHKGFVKGQEKGKRRQKVSLQAEQLDALCEEEAHEEGLLMPLNDSLPFIPLNYTMKNRSLSTLFIPFFGRRPRK